jgi:hypothetical protein
MEAVQGSLAESAEFENEVDDEEQQRFDLQEGIRIFKKVKILLDFLGDEDMIKTLSKKERKTITKIAANVHEYLENTAPVYEDEEEEAE